MFFIFLNGIVDIQVIIVSLLFTSSYILKIILYLRFDKNKTMKNIALIFKSNLHLVWKQFCK